MRARDFDRDELESLPTLAVGQADDLKIDKPGILRVWISRTGMPDGEHCDRHVTVENFDPVSGRWFTVDED